MDEGIYKLIQGVGVGAGGRQINGKTVPVVTLSLPNEDLAIDEVISDEHYDPHDGRWANYCLGVADARRLLDDVKECIEAAIAGPDNVAVIGGISPDYLEAFSNLKPGVADAIDAMFAMTQAIGDNSLSIGDLIEGLKLAVQAEADGTEYSNDLPVIALAMMGNALAALSKPSM